MCRKLGRFLARGTTERLNRGVMRLRSLAGRWRHRPAPNADAAGRRSCGSLDGREGASAGGNTSGWSSWSTESRWSSERAVGQARHGVDGRPFVPAVRGSSSAWTTSVVRKDERNRAVVVQNLTLRLVRASVATPVHKPSWRRRPGGIVFEFVSVGGTRKRT